MPRSEPVRLVELRVLDGPNLYFTRPAVKVTLSMPAWMEATEERVASLATRVGSPGPRAAGAGQVELRPGPPGSEHRRRFVARLVAHVARALAEAALTRLAVRARPGPEPQEIVVAYPWRRRNVAEATGRELAGVLGDLLGTRREFGRMLRDAATRLTAIEPGPSPSVPRPEIPVIAVTGTNGKTTTVRLLAHLLRSAGRNVAYSSTDGVYLNGELVERGDFSGFGGAARALAQPGVDVAVLEMARGGILLRGMGTAHNDVAVVTNVSADHLGLQGIRTLDQLAEVKAAITRVTRKEGWAVLNADDPRVLAMRRQASGQPWLFSLDADHPALRAALEERGRALTVIDGRMTFLAPGRDSQPLLPLEEIPVTLAGISSHNIRNAMGAASAALGVGLREEAVIEGLRSFVLDPDTNPGRTNLFELDGRIVVVDYAHNEEGMRGLTETCRGLRHPKGNIWLAYCTAGDRTNDIIHALGYVAARGADHVAVAELHHYLRGRDPVDMVERLRAGARDAGATDVPVFPDEMHALEWMLDRSRPRDVIALTALGQRPEVFALMEERGASRISPRRLRQLVRRARGLPSRASA